MRVAESPRFRSERSEQGSEKANCFAFVGDLKDGTMP